MSQIITVGMADLKTVKAPQMLMTVGLGSCIGICISDPLLKLGGMAHIMLPAANAGIVGNPAKFADTGVVLLVEEILRMGGQKSRLRAKIAGGAQMFAFQDKPQVLKIGERNAIAVETELKKIGVPILAADTGGNFGRTIQYNVGTGELHVRTINRGEKVI